MVLDLAFFLVYFSQKIEDFFVVQKSIISIQSFPAFYMILYIEVVMLYT